MVVGVEGGQDTSLIMNLPMLLAGSAQHAPDFREMLEGFLGANPRYKVLDLARS